MDETYDAGVGPLGIIEKFVVGLVDSIWVSGEFSEFGGAARSGLVKLHGKESVRVLAARTATGLEARVPTRPGKTYRLETADAVTAPNWTEVRSAPGTEGVVRFSNLEPTGAARFYRVRSE